MNSLKYLMI